MAVAASAPLVDLLRADLAAFADPGEMVEVGDAAAGWLRSRWTQGGETPTFRTLTRRRR
jgi:hypothetical protein